MSNIASHATPDRAEDGPVSRSRQWRDDLRRRLDRPIVLVGLMGSGKTTVGRKLAMLLDCPFTDADGEIEKAAQRTVAEIFEIHGEAYFRDGERRVIARIMAEGNGVIATGGGAICDDDTRALILEEGIAVWLDCEIDILVKRTAKRKSRPLLNAGDPRQILTDLYAKRAPIYALAPIRVQVGHHTHHETAERIMEAIAEWLS